MSSYLIPIETAIIIFPILAAIITIPYVIRQYRKYGAILLLRVLIVYSFIFYLLCCYFLVNLPLPSIEEVRHYTQPAMQLVPFRSLMEFTTTTSLIWNDPSTYLTAFNEPSMYLIIFNIFLTLPFGIYLRYYFRCSWKKTLLFTFLLTLSFECIQLSALFGIYPRPYRIFDVDDLLCNTLGGMLGYVITPLLSRFLPTREKLDEEAFSKGRNVSSLRRVLAFLCDIIIVLLISFAIYYGYLYLHSKTIITSLSIEVYGVYLISCVLYFFLLPILTKGKTLGKLLFKIRLSRFDETKPKWYQYSLHYIILYFVVLPTPYLLFYFIIEICSTNTSYEILIILLSVILFIFYIISIMQAIAGFIDKDYVPWFARLSRLRNYSTILYPTKEEVESNDETLIEDKVLSEENRDAQTNEVQDEQPSSSQTDIELKVNQSDDSTL